MADINLKFDIRLSRSTVGGALAALMLCACALELSSESITLTTYYPAPSGVYGRMITTGNTKLGTDGSAVELGGPLQLMKMTVASDPNAADGAIYYNASMHSMRMRDAGVWRSMGGVEIAQAYRRWTPANQPGVMMVMPGSNAAAFQLLDGVRPDAQSVYYPTVGVLRGIGCAPGWRVAGCWGAGQSTGGGSDIFPVAGGCATDDWTEKPEVSITCMR